MLLALAALDLNGKCGYFCSDPVTIAHPLCKPSVRDVYGVYNLTAFTTNIPLESWLTMTVARTYWPVHRHQGAAAGGTRGGIRFVIISANRDMCR